MSSNPKSKTIKEIFEPTPLDEFMEKNIKRLPKMPAKTKQKLLQDAKFFSEHGIKTDLPNKASDQLDTKAYPNFNSYVYVQPPRDTKKWIQAVRNYYYQTHKGLDAKEAFNQATNGMDTMEKLDFEKWLRFYQEGSQYKYKTAQVGYWENANQAGYFVPIHREDHNQLNQPHDNTSQTIQSLQNATSHPDMQVDVKRETIEKQRSKIIGRLDSAEKLMRTHEGQMFAGPELEALLDIIYQLKKKIQMVNKRSSSIRLYEDMIVREANILNSHGFIKGAALLTSIAQALPNPAEANNPLQNSGMPGNWPGEGPGMTPEQGGLNDTAIPPDPNASAAPLPAAPGVATDTKDPGHSGDAFAKLPTPSSMSPDAFPGDGTHLPGEVVPKPVSEGMKGFLEGLDTANESVDMAEAEDEGLDIHEADWDYTNGLFVEAQDVAPPVEMAPPAGPKELEMAEHQTDPEAAASKDFDSLLDSAFSGLTVQDAVNKLEEVARIFKVREISRQLSLVDLMLNQLGLAALFPDLGEAINKSLESNQYISTRIDDVLARLQGTLQTKNLDLQGNEQETNPATQQVKEQLIQEDDKEKARKKVRKDLANQEMMGAEKATPEVEMAQDLQQPTQIPAPAPQPIPTR